MRSPGGANPHPGMPRPVLTSPGPGPRCHGRDRPACTEFQNKVDKTSAHELPAEVTRAWWNSWTFGRPGNPGNPGAPARFGSSLINHARDRLVACVSLFYIHPSIPSFFLDLRLSSPSSHPFPVFTTHTTRTRTHTAKWVVRPRILRLFAWLTFADMRLVQLSTDSRSWAARSPAALLPAAGPSSSRRTPMM